MPSSHEPPRGGSGQIRPRLRLVHPAPPPAPKRRRGIAKYIEDVFAPSEVACLRLAIVNAVKSRFRTWEHLAKAMGVHRDTVRLAGVRHTLTAGVAYRFAKATGTTIEALLAARLHAVPPPSGPPKGAA